MNHILPCSGGPIRFLPVNPVAGTGPPGSGCSAPNVPASAGPEIACYFFRLQAAKRTASRLWSVSVCVCLCGQWVVPRRPGGGLSACLDGFDVSRLFFCIFSAFRPRNSPGIGPDWAVLQGVQVLSLEEPRLELVLIRFP